MKSLCVTFVFTVQCAGLTLRLRRAGPMMFDVNRDAIPALPAAGLLAPVPAPSADQNDNRETSKQEHKSKPRYTECHRCLPEPDPVSVDHVRSGRSPRAEEDPPH